MTRQEKVEIIAEAIVRALDETGAAELAGSAGGADYDSMSMQELYNLCVKRGIKANKSRKPKSYYVDLLKEADGAASGEDEAEDNDDDIRDQDEEESVDYSEMSAKELYDLCKERGIKAEKRQKPSVYIKLLEKSDEEQDDQDDDDWDEEPEKPVKPGKSAAKPKKPADDDDWDI